MDNSIIIIIEFAILMVAVSISRTQTKKAMALLSGTNREKVKAITGNGINQIIPILILVILFFMIKPYFPEEVNLLNGLFAGVMLGFLLVNGFILFRKLKKAGLPEKFIAAYIKATAVLYLGAAVFCFLAVTNPL